MPSPSARGAPAGANEAGGRGARCATRAQNGLGGAGVPDAVVIGAGHNGLVAANLLADAGWSVTVLEEQAEPGGAVRSGALTLPGFRHDLFSAFYPLAAASPVFAGLELERYGLRWRHAPLVLAHPRAEGRCAVLSRDVEETAASLEAFHPGDGAAWEELIAQWRQVADLVLAALFAPFPPLVTGARLVARLGVAEVLRRARLALLPVRRLVEERFGGEGARLLLAGCALHTDLSPETALGAAYGWFLACLGQDYGFPVPEGGAQAIIDALVARLVARGGTLRCGTGAARILIRQGRAVAVRTQAGDEIPAGRAVLAAVAAPILYHRLLHPLDLPRSLLADLDHFQWDNATVKVDWALAAPVPWAAAPARRAGTVHLADDLDNLTHYSAELACGALPARPFVLFGQQSVADPTRSPAGSETAWAYTHVPQRPRTDAAGVLCLGDEQWLTGFVERIEARIEEDAPGFAGLVRARHVLGPSGIESADASLHGGAINGGTAQLHQQLVFRPTPGLGRPETPVRALYLASASAHPGGGVHGAPGALAARAALGRTAAWRARRPHPR